MIMSGSSKAKGSSPTRSRAPHGMAEPERHLLPGETGLARSGLQFLEVLQLLGLAALRQRFVELELQVEMVLDDALVAARDEDEVLDAGFPRLVDHILDHRPVDDREHFLRDRFGRRQEPCSKPRNGEDSFSDSLHRLEYPFML